MIAISAAGGLAGVTALLFAISSSDPTRHEELHLSIRSEQSRIVMDAPIPDTTWRPARIESSFDIENTGDIAVSDIKATLTYELGKGWQLVTNKDAVEVGVISPRTSRNVKVSTSGGLSCRGGISQRCGDDSRQAGREMVTFHAEPGAFVGPPG